LFCRLLCPSPTRLLYHLGDPVCPIVSHAWQREENYVRRGAERIAAGKKVFLSEKQDGGMSVDASRSKSVEHAQTVRIRDLALGGEAWSWCQVRKTSVILSRACSACAWVVKQLPKCQVSQRWVVLSM